MKENRMKAVLESIAQRDVPTEEGLWPRIAEKVEGKKFMQILRTHPALALFLVLLALVLLSGVAYAIGKVTGYIPGIGLVDQSQPLRVLAEPVTVKRSGITLTVEQLVVSADKTVLVYKVEGIPANAYPAETNESPANQTYSAVITTDGTPESPQPVPGNNDECGMEGDLLLPNNMTLLMNESQGNGWMSGFESRVVYGAISSDINSVTFFVQCIPGTLPGALPKDWKIPLQLVPASPKLTVFPVVDITPSVPTGNKSRSAVRLEQVIETEDGYILVGKFRLIDYPANVVPNGLQVNWVKFTDANGQAVKAFPASNIQFENELNGEFSWAYEVRGKQHTFPLTITFEAVPVYILNETTEFEFDTGANPQAGQTWTVDQDMRLAGYSIRKLLIKRTDHGYEFQFKVDPDLTLLEPEIKGFPFSTGGGGNDGFGKGEIYFHIEYKGEPPSGKLVVKLGDVQAVVHGPWQAQWSPGNITPTP